VTTEDFEPDPDVPRTEQHVLYAGADVSAGMSRVAGAQTTWHVSVPFKEFWVLG
jgi:hypothetical protein